MAASVYLLNFLCRPRPFSSFKGLLIFIPTALAFLASVLIFCYISSTSTLMINLHKHNHNHNDDHLLVKHLPSRDKPIIQISFPGPAKSSVLENQISNVSVVRDGDHEVPDDAFDSTRGGTDQSQLPQQVPTPPIVRDGDEVPDADALDSTREETQNQFPQIPIVRDGDEVPDEAFDNTKEETHLPVPQQLPTATIGNSFNNDNSVFHDRGIFMENYKEMNRSLKIYVYPHRSNERFANVLLPVASEPGGNYASESYFKKALMKSHFITTDPSTADFFFLPFSIACMRHDKRIGVGGLQEFVRNYMNDVRQKYPFWNRTGGADHFYVACHSVGKMAMEKAVEIKTNAIQVVCSSNYFVYGYVPHKDVSLPQIWPRKGDPPHIDPSKRKRLAFFAGAINAPVRKDLVKAWQNDTDIFANAGRLKTPYSTELLKSKFCLHLKGFEVNTARIGDALYYGCVPVILANFYDLPFADILNWKSFSVVVETGDIPLLKRILKGIEGDEYLRLQRNVEKVRKHFQWHGKPIEYDTFHMVMYELWIRRSYVRIQ